MGTWPLNAAGAIDTLLARNRDAIMTTVRCCCLYRTFQLCGQSSRSAVSVGEMYMVLPAAAVSVGQMCMLLPPFAIRGKRWPDVARCCCCGGTPDDKRVRIHDSREMYYVVNQAAVRLVSAGCTCCCQPRCGQRRPEVHAAATLRNRREALIRCRTLLLLRGTPDNKRVRIHDDSSEMFDDDRKKGE